LAESVVVVEETLIEACHTILNKLSKEPRERRETGSMIHFVRMAVDNSSKRTDTSSSFMGDMHLLRAWERDHPDQIRSLGMALSGIVGIRNGMMHGWTTESASGRPQEQRKTVRSRVKKAVEDARGALSSIDLDALQPPVIAPVFANLSNHAIASWSSAQRAAAEAKGRVIEPEGLLGPVGVDWDPAKVQQRAEHFRDWAIEQGVTDAFVATEFTLTYALVTALRKAGIRCWAAVTERTTREEQQPDGSVLRESRYVFECWRSYAAG